VSRPRHKRKRSDFKTGFYTLLIVIVGFTFTLGIIKRKANSVEGSYYRLSFTLRNGVGSLQTGSAITAAGIAVGHIDKVSIKGSQLTANFFIRDPYKIHPGAVIYREDSVMGGGASLTIDSFGDASKPVLKSGALISSAPQPPGINELLGDRDALRIDAIRENTESVGMGMRQIMKDLEADQSIEGLSEDFQGLMTQTSEDIQAWEPRLDKIRSRLESFETRLPDMKKQFEGLTETSDVTEEHILRLRDALGPERRKLLAEAVESVIDDTRKISTRVDEELLPKIRSIIDQATNSWDELESIEGLLKSMAADARRTLQIAVAESALAAQQLVLAEKEIIGSLGIPLIERPSLEDQKLGFRIEILERWAGSAIELRRFLAAIEMLKDDPDDVRDDPLLRRLVDSLNAALLDYEEAQSHLITLTPGTDDTDDQDR